MKRIVGTIAVAALMISGALGVTAVEAGQGEGHTPVGVCHWVPAHGGSFVLIVPAVEGQCFGPE